MSKLVFTLFLLIPSASALGNPSTFSILKTDPRANGDQVNSFVILSPTGSVSDQNGWMTRQQTVINRGIKLQDITPDRFFLLWPGVRAAVLRDDLLILTFEFKNLEFRIPLRIISEGNSDRYECHWGLSAEQTDMTNLFNDFEGNLVLTHVGDKTLVKFVHAQTYKLKTPSQSQSMIDKKLSPETNSFIKNIFNQIETL